MTHEDLKKLAEALDDEEDSCRSCGLSFVSTTFARTLLRECATLQKEVEAYKRAKQENDDRFMRERDEARQEVENLKYYYELAMSGWKTALQQVSQARRETLEKAARAARTLVQSGVTADGIYHTIRALQQHTGEVPK